MKETTQDLKPNEIRFPYDISFADSDVSPATTERIESYLAKLDRHFDHITDAKGLCENSA